MAGNGDRLYFRADEQTRADVEAHMARNGFDSLSDATRDLVETGLRESNGPILHTWRESTSQVALHFALIAISVLVLGFATDIATVSAAIQVAIVFAVVGIGLIGFVEFARVVKGQNELGSQIREVRG